MKIVKVPQPWASLIMTEAINYILSPEEPITSGEEVFIYSVEEDNQNTDGYDKKGIDKILFNEIELGNLEENLPINCILGYVKVLVTPRRINGNIPVYDVHCFESPSYVKHPKADYSLLALPCKKNNYKTITYESIKKPVHVEGDPSPVSGYRMYNKITIPLCDEAWFQLITEETDIAFYWTKEFEGLQKWMDSFKDEKGFFEADIDVIVTNKGKSVSWLMLNEDIHLDYLTDFEEDKKTGKKTHTHTHKILRIGITSMESFYPDREALDKEKQRLLKSYREKKAEKAKTKKPSGHRDWVRIIYTPMGNKR